MGQRKDELIGAVIRDLLEHGVADVSLRPMAARIGTSARLLIFHFKSKHGLLTEVLSEVQARLQAAALDLPAPRPGVPPLKLYWRWATHRDNLALLRLLYEVHFIALQNPAVYGRYLRQASVSWSAIIEPRLPPSIRRSEVATLCGCVFDGLVMELLGTGDLRRTTRALDSFISMLSQHAQSQAPSADFK